MTHGIRFCTSADGTRLAYCVRGQGPAVLLATSHEWSPALDDTVPGLPDWPSLLGAGMKVVSFDVRGCGLSQREGCELSTARWLEDFDAVADAAGEQTFSILAFSHGVPPAVRYAVKRPERVRRLLLHGGYVHGRMRRPMTEHQRMEMLHLLETSRIGSGNADEYSFLFRLVFYRLYFPSMPVEFYRTIDGYAVPRHTPGNQYEYTRVNFEEDLTQVAPRVMCPTLVMHSRDDRHTPVAEGAALAGLVPGARFVAIESDNHFPLPGDSGWGEVLRECGSFLGCRLAGDPGSALTPRQQAVLRLVSHGQTDKQIARELALSPRTVEMHVSAAIKALGCATRAEAAARAASSGLLEP